jgi:SAM-dependent methyltransferase
MRRARTAQPLDREGILHLARREQRWGCPILDVRPAPQARAGHLPASAWLPVGADLEVDLPAHLLPTRGARIAVVAHDPARARAVAEHLAHRGYRAAWLDDALEETSLTPGASRGVLWSPDPYLLEQVDLLPDSDRGPVADLGAGNGRNAVFLATRGHVVHAYDRLPDALDLARDRARRQETPLLTHQRNLKCVEDLGEGPFAAVLMVRFLERALLERIHEILLPGGVLLVHTFTDREHAPGRGPRRTRYLLAPREALKLLDARRWDLLHRSSAFHQPNKTMIGLVARLRD